MVAPFERAFRIDQHVGDVLHVAHFVDAAPHFHQRIVRRRGFIGRIEQQHAAETRTKTSGQIPVFALDVVNDGRMRPGQQRRDDEPHTLAAARRGETQHMFGSVMP